LRAECSAREAEANAELETARCERDKALADLSVMGASFRKERLQWVKDRAQLQRRVAELEENVPAGHVASSLSASSDISRATVSRLEESLKESRKESAELLRRLHEVQRELRPASAKEALENDGRDVEFLMLRVADLESKLSAERQRREVAESETKFLQTEIQATQRRLEHAQTKVKQGDEIAAACAQDASSAMEEVRQSRADARHLELWLGKALGEIDAMKRHISQSELMLGDGCSSPSKLPSSHMQLQEDRLAETALPHATPRQALAARFEEGDQCVTANHKWVASLVYGEDVSVVTDPGGEGQTCDGEAPEDFRSCNGTLEQEKRTGVVKTHLSERESPKRFALNLLIWHSFLVRMLMKQLARRDGRSPATDQIISMEARIKKDAASMQRIQLLIGGAHKRICMQLGDDIQESGSGDDPSLAVEQFTNLVDTAISRQQTEISQLTGFCAKLEALVGTS
jgi:hypothetical protein